jgi:tetratricopeptide (TPR) repeat protein
MARSIDDAFANCDSDDHEVLARLYMTVGNARMSIGDRPIANELYMYSRHHALECGDQANIDALIYNKAAFALAWIRARSCYGEADAEFLRQLRLELASAKAYQQLANVSALSNFVFLWEARLHLLAGDYEQAIPALESVLQMQPFAGYNYHASLVSLEIAYCQLRARPEAINRPALQGALATDFAGLHDDDKLASAWLTSEILAAMPELGDVALARQKLEIAQAEFDSGCLDLRRILDGLAPQPHIQRPRVAVPKYPG